MSEITLLHVGSGAIGYGRYGVELHRELEAQGVDVYSHLEDPTFGEAMAHLNSGRRSKKTNVVCWVSVPTHARGWWDDQYTVISTMWEATKLPETFRESLDDFRQVIVPSKHNLELFSTYHPNVSYVPLGVDSNVWNFTPRQEPENEFRFLIGGSGERKGTDLAYKAFRKVFRTWPKDGPVPQLIMKSPKPEDYYGERILRIGGRVSAQEEVELYASAHCYLQPSRGEGFGLQPLQAIAQGLPTILTAAHGHEAFAHLGIGIDSELVKSGYFIYGDAGEWWEPDFGQLCEQMEWVYSNYAEAQSRAAQSAVAVAAEFTWEHTAERFREVLAPQLDEPYAGSGNWVKPSTRRFRLVTNKDWQADIAGVTYQFRRGVEYFELADVKRILFESGLLDPSCLETIGPDGEPWDLGLTESQLAKRGKYSAAHSHCSQCGQELNTRPTYADALEGRMIEEKVITFQPDPDVIWQLYPSFTGDLCFDIGANWGQTSEIFKDNFTKVVSYEPCIESFIALEARQWPNVEPRLMAVSDHSGVVVLNERPDALKYGELVTGDRLAYAWGREEIGERTVGATTVDEEAEMYGPPDFIKIDTEGHEVFIVAGGLDTILRHKPRLFIEIHAQENGPLITEMLGDAYRWERIDHPAYAVGGFGHQNHYYLQGEPA